MPVHGGTKLRRFLQDTRRKHRDGVRKVEIGFYESARYPNGIPVTNVAAWMQWGTRGGRAGGGWGGPVPARPFFTEAMPGIEDDAQKILRKEVDYTMSVSRQTARRIGEAGKRRIQESIKNNEWIANAEATLTMKYPKDRPLIWTGFFIRSVTYKIDI